MHQLINEHENYINKLSKDWDTHISQAAQSLLVNYDESRVPNNAVTVALERAGVDLNLIYAPCMKKFVVNKMTSLAANERQSIYNTPKRKRNRNAVDGHHQPIDRVSEALKYINRTSVSAPDQGQGQEVALDNHDQHDGPDLEQGGDDGVAGDDEDDSNDADDDKNDDDDNREPPDVLYHQALVCICCDCHIIGTE
ncbi:MAG: hypothetical protein ACQ9ET_03140, partial [Nitrosomonadaceae bacterium]